MSKDGCVKEEKKISIDTSSFTPRQLSLNLNIMNISQPRYHRLLQKSMLKKILVSKTVYDTKKNLAAAEFW